MKLKLIICLECTEENNEENVFGVRERTSIQTLHCPYCKGNRLGDYSPFDIAHVRRMTPDDRKNFEIN